MLRVKIFSSNDSEYLNGMINQWLINTKVEIVDKQICATAVHGTNSGIYYGKCYIVIWYKDI